MHGGNGMARLRHDRLLAVDTEWTCWEGEPPPGQEREIVEIGIVEADPRSMEILREGRFLVRPALSSVSAYCTDLTGLTQDELRRHGRPLAEVMRTLAKAFGPGSKPWLAWGDDRGGIVRACARLGADNPFPDAGFMDLGLHYAMLSGARERTSLASALSALGLEPEGRAHTAVADARNALRIQMELSCRMRAGLEPREDRGMLP
jgi:inhibitor of KinA sporulation pathway (predicted exonuclease)